MLINGVPVFYDDIIIDLKDEYVLACVCRNLLTDYTGFEKYVENLEKHNLVHIMHNKVCTATMLGFNYIIHANILKKKESLMPLPITLN